MSELGFERVRRQQPHARALLLAGFGQHELAAVREHEPEHRRLRGLRAGRVIAQPAGAHQVDAEHELAVDGREEEVLAPAARPREAPADERGEGRIERLQRRDVGWPGALDSRPRDERIELANPRLDFR